MIRTVARLGVVSAVAVLAACAGDAVPGDTATPSVTVELAQTVVRDYAVTVTALGTVVARPGGAARISAPGESVVTAIRVAPGDIVAAGAPLVELDQSVWSEQARQAEASLAAADEAQARAERLVERGSCP